MTSKSTDIALTKIYDLGFQGDIKWIHNEEGSGAKYFNCSVYYPDDRKNPQTLCGVTIDPGLDLGHASNGLINEVVKFYMTEGLINKPQMQLLIMAKKLRKYAAISWLNQYEQFFKNRQKFLIGNDTAAYVMAQYTAPEYWTPLIEKMPELLKISKWYLRIAIHTALLSQSYNRGYTKVIELSQDYLKVKNYDGLAKAIKNIWQPTQSLKNRRRREAQLIIDALERKNDFTIDIDESETLKEKVKPYAPVK